MTAIPSFSTAAASPLGRGAFWRPIVKGRLAYFSQKNLWAIIPLSRVHMLRRLASAGLMPTQARGNYLPKPPYLRETKTYHSQPLESIRHAGNYFVPYQYGPFLFFVVA